MPGGIVIVSLDMGVVRLKKMDLEFKLLTIITASLTQNLQYKLLLIQVFYLQYDFITADLTQMIGNFQ